MPVSRGIWATLRFSGLPAVMRRLLQARNVTILCYHDPEPGLFARHLEALSRRYRFVSLEQYMDARAAGTMAVLPRFPLVITLDDGHAGNMDLVDTFRRFGVRPTIFLTSGVVGTRRAFWWDLLPGGEEEAERLKALPDDERLAALSACGRCETEETDAPSALSRDDVTVLRADADLQSHTVLHPVLARCGGERAWAEIASSKTDLEREYGLTVYAIAYPNGKTGDEGSRESMMAARAGYRCGLTAVAGLNDRYTDPFELHRIVIPDDAGVDELIVRTSLLADRLTRLTRRHRRSVASVATG
jgi:peptidoglycan/xylan/chitin deacetylase (PgdA/CDA1 family)